jgi:hypothetical protein
VEASNARLGSGAHDTVEFMREKECTGKESCFLNQTLTNAMTPQCSMTTADACDHHSTNHCCRKKGLQSAGRCPTSFYSIFYF